MFDASALLCFLQGESGADVVERELGRDPACSAVNWSEVAQKVITHGADWELARSLLLSFGIRIEPVTAATPSELPSYGGAVAVVRSLIGSAWPPPSGWRLTSGPPTLRGAPRTTSRRCPCSAQPGPEDRERQRCSAPAGLTLTI